MLGKASRVIFDGSLPAPQLIRKKTTATFIFNNSDNNDNGNDNDNDNNNDIN